MRCREVENRWWHQHNAIVGSGVTRPEFSSGIKALWYIVAIIADDALLKTEEGCRCIKSC
jgi:hypothetical protein